VGAPITVHNSDKGLAAEPLLRLQCGPFRCEGKIVYPDCCIILRMNGFAE
jgi:hypothetical protein